MKYVKKYAKPTIGRFFVGSFSAFHTCLLPDPAPAYSTSSNLQFLPLPLQYRKKMGLMYFTIDLGTASQATPQGRHRKRTG
jgi:hypothetical protein